MTEFGKCLGCKEPKEIRCKGLCKKCYLKQYHESRRDETNKKCRDYYQKHRDRIIKQKMDYYNENKEELWKKWKQNRDANKEEINKRRREEYIENREEVLAKYRLDRKLNPEKHKKYNRQHYLHNKERYKTDPQYMLRRCLSSRMRGLLKAKSIKKIKSAAEFFGADLKIVKEHIEKQFVEGMSWSNHGEWHIDHIVPCASFDFYKENDIKKCFHYTNLQPLWGSYNMSIQNKPKTKENMIAVTNRFG